jgi:hypothetical protein
MMIRTPATMAMRLVIWLRAPRKKIPDELRPARTSHTPNRNCPQFETFIDIPLPDAFADGYLRPRLDPQAFSHHPIA